MARKQYKRTYFYSIGSMLTDEEVHQIWEIVGNALDRNGFLDADLNMDEVIDDFDIALSSHFLASRFFISQLMICEFSVFIKLKWSRGFTGGSMKISWMVFAPNLIFK